jgi:hypothetical protein
MIGHGLNRECMPTHFHFIVTLLLLLMHATYLI